MGYLLHRYVLLPTFETVLKRRQTFRHWRDLERSQWLPRDEIQRIQLEALGRLLRHAYDHCPYYRDAWSRHGLHPGDLKNAQDFRHWPVTDRATIREHRQAMRATTPGLRLLSKSTGGSTGVPLHFDLDTGSNDRRTAAWHRGYAWAGAAPGTRQLYLWGVPLGQRPAWRIWKDALYNRFHRRLVLNTFGLSEQNVGDYLARLNRYRPDALVAYAQSLYVFARILTERGLVPYSPRGVVVGAEKLYPHQRRVIEEVFRAPVFETYGSREFMLIAAECSHHQGLHLTAENLLVELLDDDGNPVPGGTEGNVVITDLTNYGMPFIRYSNGDRAVAGLAPCPCGRGLPLLAEVTGRRTDVVQTPGGGHVSGLFFPHLLKDYPEVRQFQVVQDRPDRVKVRLVLAPSWDQDKQDTLSKTIRATLGEGMRVEVLAVPEIPLTASGKQCVVVNRCASAVATTRSL